MQRIANHVSILLALHHPSDVAGSLRLGFSATEAQRTSDSKSCFIDLAVLVDDEN